MTRVESADAEASVQARYSNAAQAVEPALCCPVTYDANYLKALPKEVLERDYGCGDPTPFVRAGDVVLDLGAGGGKVCYIAAQIVGASGKVYGVDCNQEMLALARRHRDGMAERLGYSNVEFRCGMIQDLRLDLDLLADELARRPVHDQNGWLGLRLTEDRLRRERPLIADETIDCVISNCVLNLVCQSEREQLFAEIFRVLKPNGRAAISDIVADDEVPAHLQQDAELWSGCISGAYREEAFLRAFERAGFHGVQLVKREQRPWRTVAGIDFRSATVLAYKGERSPEVEHSRALIYRGPFRNVEDDDGRVFPRGRRVAVGAKTFELLRREPYFGFFETASPLDGNGAESVEVDSGRAPPKPPSNGLQVVAEIAASGSCCKPDGCCE